MDVDGDALFAGHPELRAVHLASMRYPPLARQTRIAGTVVVHVTVGNDGSVNRSRE
jgi:outer membrane biosynthesis protein TonB